MKQNIHDSFSMAVVLGQICDVSQAMGIYADKRTT